ncbi:MAG: SAM-dependent methyltransferase [Alphaproteobacteria bacterium]|nr:SAM-dependent methyltransferase [Alphaproteobacteria bacterium]
MTLESLLKERIREHGPISIADYMAMCLTHPEYGYYMRRDPLGVAGDFTTAPEISQIFGELLGLWLAAQWQKQGRPEAALVEFGPGRGTLMADMLRATRKVAGFHDALSVHLVEASPVLKQKQWAALAGKHPHISWQEDIAALPDVPVFAVANEFFDALPIRQFMGNEERKVEVDGQGELQFTPPGEAIVEKSPASLAMMRNVASRIAGHGGAFLVVDYGYTGGSRGDTLQAVRQHHYHPVLADPGEADLTAHVDFDALMEVAQSAGATTFGALPQGKFLLQIGASQRLMNLCAAASEPQQKELMNGFERLISHEQMGELFKVLAVLPSGGGRPEGF